jgi:hypothetical protein
MVETPNFKRATERNAASAGSGLVFLALGLAALLAAQFALTNIIKGTNYPGADGKAAQATILTMLEFARWLDVNTLNPLQGVGSQMMPMNVWANPAYWPFAFFDKQTAATLSGLVALGIFAISCFASARCFDLPVLPSILAAQSCMVLFGPTVLILGFGVVFSVIPGLAVLYALHLLAVGLLNRLQPVRSQFVPITGGILLLVCWSLYADPLWSMVSGIAWIVAFAVVTFATLRWNAILIRCAALGTCLAVLLLSGALEYAYTLSQYTARVQFPQLLQRPQLREFASVLFLSPYAKYFYGSCATGWLLGLWLLRGGPQVLVLAAVASAITLMGYSSAYLSMNGSWWLPLPIYIEHALFALFIMAAFAGYWGALQAFGSYCRERTPRTYPRFVVQSFWPTIVMVLFVFFLPGLFIRFGISFNALNEKFAATFWNEPWPDEPELRKFFVDNIGLGADRQFRGSASFSTGGVDEFRTLSSLWLDRVPTANEYSQLVSPQSIYLLKRLFKKDLRSELNWFRPSAGAGASYPVLFRTLQAMGVRYISGYDRVPDAEAARLPSVSLPRRPYLEPEAAWLIYELPDVNVGNYSPTEVMIAGSAAEIVTVIQSANFDYTRQAALSTALPRPLRRASNMRLSIDRGGLHVSGHSDGTSLVVLPQQFSNCLRAHDSRVRLIRADLMLTGLVFSGDIDTEITFNYGIFSPQCRRADLADITQLGMQLGEHPASHRVPWVSD